MEASKEEQRDVVDFLIAEGVGERIFIEECPKYTVNTASSLQGTRRGTTSSGKDGCR